MTKSSTIDRTVFMDDGGPYVRDLYRVKVYLTELGEGGFIPRDCNGNYLAAVASVLAASLQGMHTKSPIVNGVRIAEDIPYHVWHGMGREMVREAIACEDTPQSMRSLRLAIDRYGYRAFLAGGRIIVKTSKSKGSPEHSFATMREAWAWIGERIESAQ